RLVQARVEKAKADGDGKFPPVTAAEVEQVYRAEHASWKERYDAAVEKYRAECAKEHDEVVGLGGLHILGTERHESRRIDNQLRGRSGRQGDPGSSKFYLSLEDDLMRIFASDRIAKLMDTFGVQENEPIEHPWLTKAIQGAQERVEGQNFDIRKNLLEYDDVMNQQRKTIYGMRKEVLAAGAGVPLVWFTEDPKTKKKTRHEKVVSWKDQEEHLYDLIEDLIIEIVDEAVPRGKNDEFDTKALQQRVREQFNVDMSFEGAHPDKEKLQLDVFSVVEKKLKTKFEVLGDDFRLYTQWLYLNTIDQLWKDHLLQMDHLRQGIHLRGYGQKDPKIEYKKEGFELFQIMKGRIAASTIAMVMRVEPVQQQQPQPAAATQAPAQGRASGTLPPLPQRRQQQTIEIHGEAPTASGGQGGTVVQNQTAPIVRAGPRVGRNDPCPCGSGKKYKKCHLPMEQGTPADQA
ncbi:MAG TPA: SEC-C metal-binding domain-containing protein, partial [Myxococcales bacterium]